jgi:hypothetical protein
VSQQSYDRKQLQDLKAAAKELHELSLGVGRAIDSAAETGELQKAKDAFAELELKTAEYEKFRATLSPEVLFLAKYNVEVHGPHEVSFVLPKGVSRIEMLQEAQSLVGDRDLIFPDHLTKWQEDPKFTTAATTSQRIHIDGHIEGGDAKSRQQQEAFLTARGLQMPSLEDLAAAFVAHYIATKNPLFGFYKNNDYTYWVRAAGGALYFNSYGLSADAYGIIVDCRSDNVAVAAALPGIKK